MAVYFVSDLHLDPGRPEATARFVEFMRGPAASADAVYILGDLFEAWIGDDDDDPELAPILEALRELTAAQVPCYFMHGNRDFLVGSGFTAATGVALLDEFAVVDLDGEPLLLTHGDLLCTDDTRYLTLRAQLRDPAWQADFLAKSLAERRRVAAELRELSQTEMATKSEAIMDVNAATVRATMERFGVRRLLHGHTHRPGLHRFPLDGRESLRVVLPDWYGAGGYVRWDEHGPQLHLLDD